MSDLSRQSLTIEEDRSTSSEEKSLTEAGFLWREHEGVRVLVCRALEDAGFTNGFSTRLGGVSPFPAGDLNLAGYDEDAAENIEENRRRFLKVWGGDLRLATVWQVHRDKIHVVGNAGDAARTDERADAVVSDMRGILAGVKTADCVPVLVGDPVKGTYAAIHAGWRGTSMSVVTKALRKMSDIYGSRPADMIAAIGPAATCANYEVGQDVIDAFDDRKGRAKYFIPTRDGHALVDLIAANRDELMDSGIPPENIRISPFCTMERTDLFFSYRIEKKKYGRTGRLLSVIGRR